MLRYLADENFNNDIVRGIRRRLPEVDIARVQDVGLSGTDDPTVLAWAANHGRLLLTHDVRTITAYARQRVQSSLPMPGVVESGRGVPMAVAIEDLILLAQCSLDSELEGQILYLPLR